MLAPVELVATQSEWRARQYRLNEFTKRWVKGIAPLIVDGRDGQATRKRIRNCHWWTGYNVLTDAWDDQFDYRLRHPWDPTRTTPKMIARGAARRKAHNAAWVRSHQPTTGVTTYDGVPVAAVAVPLLNWARAHGWQGRLVSGYRSPAYSQSLCYAMCGRPSCPGKCAGVASNHVGTTAARFAVDVSDYWNFGRLMRQCPLSPHVTNHLPADQVHFSPSGY